MADRKGEPRDLVDRLVRSGAPLDCHYCGTPLSHRSDPRTEVEREPLTRPGGPCGCGDGERLFIYDDDGVAVDWWLRCHGQCPHVWPYCTAAPGYTGATADHVLPRSRGGSDDPCNLVLACHDCNAKKGTRTPEEWQRSRRYPPMPGR